MSKVLSSGEITSIILSAGGPAGLRGARAQVCSIEDLNEVARSHMLANDRIADLERSARISTELLHAASKRLATYSTGRDDVDALIRDVVSVIRDVAGSVDENAGVFAFLTMVGHGENGNVTLDSSSFSTDKYRENKRNAEIPNTGPVASGRYADDLVKAEKENREQIERMKQAIEAARASGTPNHTRPVDRLHGDLFESTMSDPYFADR